MLPSSINGVVGKKIPYFIDNIGNDHFYFSHQRSCNRT